MPCGVPHAPEVVASIKSLVETSDLTYAEISAKKGVPANTIVAWTRRLKWRRLAGVGGRLSWSPERVEAARRVFEDRATVADIAVLIGCSERRLYQMAEAGEWIARRSAQSPEPPSAGTAEMAAVASALRDPTAPRGELIRLIEQATALAVADALTTGDARCEQRAIALGKYAAIVKTLPERRASAAREDLHAADPDDHFPDANDLIEEIARRIEADANEWLDPRVLAAIAAAVP